MGELRPERLGDDVRAKPALLRARAGDDASAVWACLPGAPARVLLIGMGSSYFAAGVAARRLRRLGVTAVAERASVEAAWPPRAGDVVVAVSAGGTSRETIAAAARYAGSPAVLVALTNAAGSPLAAIAHHEVPMAAGAESSGMSVRTFTATLVRLLQLEGALIAAASGLADRLDAAADAVDELIGGCARWLDDAVAALAGPHGTWLLAPAERDSSARQGALMLREAPRRAAVGCETGDWSHVDVYLTKTLDYRAMVFAGSRWDAAAARWLTERGSTFWSIGGVVAGAARVVRYAHDADPVVALLAETTVPEMLAARLAEG